MTPGGMDWDCEWIVDSRFINGGVDAIFKIENRVVIVDWKTGKKENSNQLQLAIYRIAWSLRHQIPLSEIDAAFVYLPSMEIQQPTKLPDLAEIEQLILNA